MSGFGHMAAERGAGMRLDETHRAQWLFFRERTNRFHGAPKTMLHIAA